MIGPRRFLFVGLAAFAVSGTAIAADIPSKGPFYKAPPAFAWDGWYVGAHAGYAWGRTDLDTFLAGPEALDPKGAFGGLQIGFLRHLSPNWVLGFELDASTGDVEATGRQQIDYFGTARTRIGYAQGPWLIYGTGGVAFAWSNVAPVGIGDGHELPHVGWVVGAGVEYALNRNWSVKLEYLHADLDNITVVRGAVTVTEDMSLNVVRLGVNYRFGEVRAVQALGYAPQGPSRYPASWTGVYVGVHGGYASGLQSLEPFAGALASPHQNGGFGGFQSGANWQFARNWLVGLEADSSWGSINGNENGARAKIDSLGTARGRLGYIMNHWIFYGTAGLAWAHSEAFVPADTAHDRFLLGWAAGMGVEYAFSDRWSLKLEYLYTDFFSNQSSVNTNSEAQTADLHIVKFGINYRASLLELIGWR